MNEEQRQRFDQVVAHMQCDHCPIQKECFDSSNELGSNDIPPSCEDTLYHYVMTGEFLPNEKEIKL